MPQQEPGSPAPSDADPPEREERPWRPPPFIAASIVLHAAALAGMIARPRHARSLGRLLLLDHALFCTLGLLPRNALLGSNLVRLPAAVHQGVRVALTFDDGPDPSVTPQVLDLLDQFEAKASFFCIAERAERHAELTREIVRRGHRLENHTYHHPLTFALKGWRTQCREIDAAQRSLTRLGGRRPRYFRAPAGFRNPMLDAILHPRRLQLASWTRRAFDTVENRPATVSRRLLRGLDAGDILLLHDGSAARDRDGRAVVLGALPTVLEEIHRRALRACPLP